jgi:hypothetical protein
VKPPTMSASGLARIMRLLVDIAPPARQAQMDRDAAALREHMVEVGLPVSQETVLALLYGMFLPSRYGEGQRDDLAYGAVVLERELERSTAT